VSGRDNILRRLAFKYVRAWERYEQAMESGRTEEADKQLSICQTLERETTVTCHTQSVLA
jgi:hypothetical protein